jgi:hypothetical protein
MTLLILFWGIFFLFIGGVHLLAANIEKYEIRTNTGMLFIAIAVVLLSNSLFKTTTIVYYSTNTAFL